jgi:hypothetical protein
MAIADSWEHTWRSGMIVGGTGDDAPEAEPTIGLGTRIGLLAVVGLVAAGALTVHVRLHVLKAEQRRLVHQIDNTKAATEVLRCRVADASSPELISAHAEREGMRPPVTIAEICPPTVTSSDADPETKSAGSELRRLCRTAAQNAARRLGAIMRGPADGR